MPKAKFAQFDGLPAFNMYRFLYYFNNPYRVIASDKGARAYAFKIPTFSDRTMPEKIMRPDVYDVSGMFYKGRTFVQMLDVDNSLVLPYGTNIKLSITADDVIH